MRLQFPEGFLLGVSSASAQIEGGEVGSNWNDWYHQGRIKDGSDPAVADDHWNRWREDCALMAGLHLPVARLGVEWARIMPERGQVDESAVAHYRAELEYLRQLGILPEGTQAAPPEVDEKFDLQIAGVNHCTWILRCFYDGKDYMPVLRSFVEREAKREYETRPTSKAKPRLNMNYALELMDLYGAFPTAVSHTKEYVPFYQGYGVTPVTPEPIVCFDGYNRAEEMAEAWSETEKIADGTTPIGEFFAKGRGDHATDIIESMWGNLGKKFYINSPNRGAVGNLPDDAFLELLCDLDMKGPRPRPVGDMPRGLLGLTQQVLDTHELTVEAAVSCDRQILLRALATDPLVNNLSDAKHIMAELLEAERDHLDRRWF